MESRYLYGQAVDQILARWDADSGDTFFHLTDNLGSVRQNVAAATGVVVNEIVYDAHGNILSETNPASGDRIKWTAREWDALVGLNYHRTRWYDPLTARWTGEDPIGFDAGQTNLAVYVGNGPLNGTDPSGLEEDTVYVFDGFEYKHVPASEYYAEPEQRPIEFQEASWTDYARAWDWGNYGHGVVDVVKGYGDAAVNIAKGIYQVGRHPIQTLQGLYQAFTNPCETITAIIDDYREKSRTLRGQGEIFGDILISLATGGSVKAAKESGRIGRLLDKVRNLGGGGRKSVSGSRPAPSAVSVPQTTAGRNLLELTPESQGIHQLTARFESVPESMWADFPAGVPRPTGTINLIEGAAYDTARAAANKINRTLSRAFKLGPSKHQVHEIVPVKFGGSPTDLANKVALHETLHRPVTTWFARLQRLLEGGK